MLVNVFPAGFHVGAIILLAGIVTMYVWRPENDVRKNKIGLHSVIAGAMVIIISLIAIALNFIVLLNV